MYKSGRWTREKAKLGMGMANEKRKEVQNGMGEKIKEERRKRGEQWANREEDGLNHSGDEEPKEKKKRRERKDDGKV